MGTETGWGGYQLGYARVSTLEQDEALQLDALKSAGCDRLFVDKVSGKLEHRPALDVMLEQLRAGDTVVVWRLDRLGRSLRHLIEIFAELEQREVAVRSLTESLDTSTPGGKLVFHVFAALAEFERDLNRERTLAGLALPHGFAVVTVADPRCGPRQSWRPPTRCTRAENMTWPASHVFWVSVGLRCTAGFTRDTRSPTNSRQESLRPGPHAAGPGFFMSRETETNHHVQTTRPRNTHCRTHRSGDSYQSWVSLQLSPSPQRR